MLCPNTGRQIGTPPRHAHEQLVNNRALRGLAELAAGHHLGQHGFHAMEVGNLARAFRQSVARRRVHARAGVVAAVD